MSQTESTQIQGITSKIQAILTRPFRVKDHEYLGHSGFKAWYIEPDQIRGRLDEADPNWSSRMQQPQFPCSNDVMYYDRETGITIYNNFIAVETVQLCVRGVVRTGIGEHIGVPKDLRELVKLIQKEGKLGRLLNAYKFTPRSAGTAALQKAAKEFRVGGYLAGIPEGVNTYEKLAAWMKKKGINNPEQADFYDIPAASKAKRKEEKATTAATTTKISKPEVENPAAEAPTTAKPEIVVPEEALDENTTYDFPVEDPPEKYEAHQKAIWQIGINIKAAVPDAIAGGFTKKDKGGALDAYNLLQELGIGIDPNTICDNIPGITDLALMKLQPEAAMQ